jgi:hypothetical protein
MIAMRESMKTLGRTLSVLALVLAVTPACITEPDTVTNDASNVIVQIVRMQGQSVDDQGIGDSVDDLFSDVCFSVTTLNGQTACSVFNDNGVVTMRAFPKDRTQLASEFNSITIERYRVTYVRADGRNVPGVDVPHPFDGVANFLVPVTTDEISEVERGFVIVRHQAKHESPLREISLNPSATISVLAQVDFYGHDSAGRLVTVTGYLNITFADFG